MKGISTMQNSYRLPQPNNYDVNPVCRRQPGSIADGKYCIVGMGFLYLMNERQV